MRRTALRRALFVSCAVLAGCGRAATREGATAPSGFTDGAVALQQLDVQLEGAERALARDANDEGARIAAVDLHLARATCRGRLDDLRQAEVLSQPGGATANLLLARARVALALHRFDGARRLFDAVDRLDGRGRTRAGRLAIFAARGDFDRALPLAETLARVAPNLENLGSLAALQARTGDAGALVTFASARAAYRDVSPFPIAWLAFQEGLAREALHDPSGARAAYAEAVRLVPGHPAATAHLAALQSDPAAALALLQPLTASSDDPEFLGQLALLELVTGQPGAARAHRHEARARFDTLLAWAPEAFADHAARFFLATGDPGKALSWARVNAENRPTPEARELEREARVASR